MNKNTLIIISALLISHSSQALEAIGATVVGGAAAFVTGVPVGFSISDNNKNHSSWDDSTDDTNSPYDEQIIENAKPFAAAYEASGYKGDVNEQLKAALAIVGQIALKHKATLTVQQAVSLVLNPSLIEKL